MKTQEQILNQCTQGFELFPNASKTEREAMLSSIYSAMSQCADQEQDLSLHFASQQFTGWEDCRSNGQIIDLVISMGLDVDEWAAIKKDFVHGLRDQEVKEIDEYFESDQS